MIGGGNSIFCDEIWQCPSLAAWTEIPDIEVRRVCMVRDRSAPYTLLNTLYTFPCFLGPQARNSHPFTEQMRDEVRVQVCSILAQTCDGYFST